MRAELFAWARRGLLAAGLIAAGATVVPAPADAAYIRAGVLTCKVAGGVGLIIGSSKGMRCTFSPTFRGIESYGGRINKVGLDVGITGETVIVWAVLASQTGFPVGALAGRYVGASAEASIVIGVGANILVGGSNKSFALQPLSIQGQLGLNVAAGVTSLDLWR
jgi:hypothetical protein